MEFIEWILTGLVVIGTAVLLSAVFEADRGFREIEDSSFEDESD